MSVPARAVKRSVRLQTLGSWCRFQPVVPDEFAAGKSGILPGGMVL
jgi:hypothetical protein